MATNEVRYKFTAEDSQFKRVAGNVTNELKKMAKDGSLGVAALATAFYAVGRAMQDTLNRMDQISKMSLKTGVSVEALSALRYAAEMSDVSLESLETALIKLSKAINANDPAFTKMGVKLTDANGKLRSNEDILLDVADAFQGMEEGAQQTAIATAIFGRAGADMIPMLNGGKEGVTALMEEAERLGVTFDTVSAQKAERFNDSITSLQNSAMGFVQELVIGLMPAIDNISNAMETASGKSGNLGSKLTPLQAIARGVAVGFQLVTMGIVGAGEAIALLVIAIIDSVKYLGSLLKMLYQFSQGDLAGGMQTWDLANAKAFKDTTFMWKKLKDDSFAMMREMKNTALGNVSGGDVKSPIGGSGGDDDDKGGKKTNGQKKEEIDELKVFQQEKVDALKVIEESWTEWQLEHEDATAQERLRAYRDYLLRRQTYLSQFTNSEQFGQLSAGDRASVNNEIIQNNDELQKLNITMAKINESIFAQTPLGRFGTSIDLAKIFGMPKELLANNRTEQLVEKSNNFIKSVADVKSNNPKVDLSVFDTLENQQKENFAKKNETINQLSKEKIALETEIDNEIKRQLDSGISKENASIVALNNAKLNIDKTYLDTKLQLEQNYADASKMIEQEAQDAKIGIISNALGTIAGMLYEHTLMYQILASAQAVIDTYAAATKALFLPPPWGEIQMAATIASGLANVANIWGVKFAKGGLITQPTLALMGEAGAEFVAPQRDFMSYTQQIIRTVQNEKMESGFVGNLKLRGNDLVVAVERASATRGRLGV